jgi:hypothetical protein
MSALNAVQRILMLITIKQEDNDMYNNYYTHPSPHSFGDTRALERSIKAEKEEFKKTELKKELHQENRENGDNG